MHNLSAKVHFSDSYEMLAKRDFSLTSHIVTNLLNVRCWSVFIYRSVRCESIKKFIIKCYFYMNTAKNLFFISVFIIKLKLCNVLSIMRSPGNGSILSEMECLNTRFPGSLCITCYVGIQCETQKI